jgi:hypothetical protein
VKKLTLSDMKNGWFVGDFEPTVIRTDTVEVAVKEYRKGDREAQHHHRLATEITVIASGLVRMNGFFYGKGDIIVIPPNESTDFEVLEDTITTVVKFPGARNDKYPGDPT